VIVGCYTLELYCDNRKPYPEDEVHGYSEFPHQYTDELGSVCRRDARRDGWVLGKGGAATCPKCSGKKRKPRIKSAMDKMIDGAKSLSPQEIFARHKAQGGGE